MGAPGSTGRVRAYLGASVDGRIAGPEHQLDWLDGPHDRRVPGRVPTGPDTYLDYEAFTADVGAMLMGRTTFDVVSSFETWPYGDADTPDDGPPIVVATSRPLPDDVPAGVVAASGTVHDLVAAARGVAGGRDVYADGGRLVSSLLDAGLLDELTVTVLPTVRGTGIGLFDSLRSPRGMDCTRVATNEAGFVQLTWVPHT